MFPAFIHSRGIDHDDIVYFGTRPDASGVFAAVLVPFKAGDLMSHFTIHKDGQRVGSVLALESGRVAVCFNRRFPQFRDTEGTPDQVRFTLKKMIPGAKYEPLDLPRLDAWLQEIDNKYAAMQSGEEREGEMNI